MGARCAPTFHKSSTFHKSPPVSSPLQREGLDIDSCASLLVQITAGLSAGQLLAFVQQLKAAREAAAIRDAAAAAAAPAARAASTPQPQRSPSVVRWAHAVAAGAKQDATFLPQQQGQQKQTQHQAPELEDLAVEVLPSFVPLSSEDAAALREWTVRVHLPLPPEVGGRWVGGELGGRLGALAERHGRACSAQWQDRPQPDGTVAEGFTRNVGSERDHLAIWQQL